MYKRALLLISVAVFWPMFCAEYKDSFVIDVKNKGTGAVKFVPLTGTLELYKQNVYQSGLSIDEIDKLDHLSYGKLDFSTPLPFPNGLIKQGYVFVNLEGFERSSGAKKHVYAAFEIKPNHYYSLSLPAMVTKQGLPSYYCSDGSEAPAGFLCVTATKMSESQEKAEEQTKAEEEEISEDDPRYIWRMPMD